MNDFIEQMETCEQAPGLNMLQHGQLVHDKYKELISALNEQDIKYAELSALYTRFKHSLPPLEVLRNYHWYHDCGKSLCLVIGEDGKRRYPNHAEVSANLYAEYFPDDGFTAQLIRRDMGFHTLKGDELVQFCKSPFAPILYFTAHAELEANAEMFGSTSSESYKIKRSRLIQAGKKLLNT